MSAEPIEARMAGLEGSYRELSQRLTSIDRRLDSFEVRVDHRFDALNQWFDQRFDSLQWRMTSLMLGSWVTLLAAILGTSFIRH